MKQRKPQRGVVLIVALIFLIALALLGISGSMNNVLQERMASNTRNHNLAFQAAEHALKEADISINAPGGEPIITCPNPNPSLGHPLPCQNPPDHPNDANYWRNTFDWTTNNTVTNPVAAGNLTLGEGGIADQPRYVIEQMSGGTCSSGTCRFYRITARGVSTFNPDGTTAKDVVILQSMYRFPD